jgi:predicted nucleic acid-binding Zn ribbon protein
MSAEDDATRAAEFARNAFARARAHARKGSRVGGRNVNYSGRFQGHAADEPIFSSARPDRRDPIEFGLAMQELVEGHGWSDDITVAGVTARWADIVGPDVAEHVSVEAFEIVTAPDADSTARIVLRADSTAWATQMRLLLPALRQRLSEETGGRMPLEIRVLAPAAPSWRHGSRHVSGRGPRDTYG